MRFFQHPADGLVRAGVGQPQLDDPPGQQPHRPVPTSFGHLAARLGHQPRFSLFREARAGAGAWPLVQSPEPLFDEAAARALNCRLADAQGGDDLRIGRASRGVEQDAGAGNLAGLRLPAPHQSLQRGAFVSGQVNEILLHVGSASCDG